jgi:DNA-binding response OmpR family regulator
VLPGTQLCLSPRHSAERPEPAASALSESKERRWTIIVADDEASVRFLVLETLGRDDYNLIEASDGDEAWSLIQTYRPSLVLLDIRMPGRTGLDILHAIRTEAELASTKVILLTASAQHSDVEAGLSSGADFYLTKPFSPRDLLSKVDEALEL